MIFRNEEGMKAPVTLVDKADLLSPAAYFYTPKPTFVQALRYMGSHQNDQLKEFCGLALVWDVGLPKLIQGRASEERYAWVYPGDYVVATSLRNTSSARESIHSFVVMKHAEFHQIYDMVVAM